MIRSSLSSSRPLSSLSSRIFRTPSSPAVLFASNTRLFGTDWREKVKEKVAREKFRARIEQKVPTRVVEAEEGENDSTATAAAPSSAPEGSSTGYVVAHDISPEQHSMMVDKKLREEEFGEENTAEGADDNDFSDTISSYADAKEAFESRRQLTEHMAEKRSQRQEDKARWLMWQAAQREKGFEQRMRRKIDKQRAAQKLRFSQIDGRMLTVGAGSASDFVRQRTVDGEREQRIDIDAVNATASDEAAVAVPRYEDDLADEELDDLLTLQQPKRWAQVRKRSVGEPQSKQTAATAWGEAREYRSSARF